METNKLHKLWVHEKQWGKYNCFQSMLRYLIFVECLQLLYMTARQTDTELVLNPDVFKDFVPGDIVGIAHSRGAHHHGYINCFGSRLAFNSFRKHVLIIDTRFFCNKLAARDYYFKSLKRL